MVREPCFVLVKLMWPFARAVRLHPPYLHRSRLVAIVINVLAVRGIFRTIDVSSFVVGELDLFTSIDRDFINVVDLAIALTYKGNLLAVRGPAVPERRSFFSQHFR